MFSDFPGQIGRGFDLIALFASFIIFRFCFTPRHLCRFIRIHISTIWPIMILTSCGRYPHLFFLCRCRFYCLICIWCLFRLIAAFFSCRLTLWLGTAVTLISRRIIIARILIPFNVCSITHRYNGTLLVRSEHLDIHGFQFIHGIFVRMPILVPFSTADYSIFRHCRL